MKAIKKINNNVAVCVDNNNKELIAFGKGIGFHVMPYEIVDLSLISMTFYRIDNRFYKLIEEIPENIFEVAVLIVQKAQVILKCNLNPNLVASLADHINFAIIRMKKYKKMKMLFSYDVEQLYPKETELGKYAVDLIKKKLYVNLPDSEITNIAMHFVNAEEENYLEVEGSDNEVLISEIVDKIEEFFTVSIDRNDFNYNRFAMHLRYYIKRVKDKTQFMDDNLAMVQFMKEKNPKIYECAFMIGSFIDKKLNSTSTEDELLYLMMHINRIIKKITIED